MSLRELKLLMASLSYEGVRSVPLGTECARWGVSQWQFEELQERWLLGLERPTHESIPWVSVVLGEYRFYRLAKDDPRGIFLGLHTDCCQHPGGAGSSCAWHGYESPDGAYDDMVRQLYEKAATAIIGRLGVTEVRVGVGYTDVSLGDLPRVQPIEPPAGVYSDAGAQVLLAGGES